MSELPPSFDEWRVRWEAAFVASHHVAYPNVRPYPYEMFDGCTGAPDVCRPCCLMHDLLYWYLEAVDMDRAKADRMFRQCIFDMSKHDEWFWGSVWGAVGVTFWLAVRLFGRSAVSKRLEAWERAR